MMRLALRSIAVASILAGIGMSAGPVFADPDRVTFQPVAETTTNDRDNEQSVYEAPKPVYIPVPELPGFLSELTADMDDLIAK
jgi:hypothetical protein